MDRLGDGKNVGSVSTNTVDNVSVANCNVAKVKRALEALAHNEVAKSGLIRLLQQPKWLMAARPLPCIGA
jgi:hypothetical protein